jgi:hypothetical protein
VYCIALLQYWRTPSYNFTRYIVTILVAILYGEFQTKGFACAELTVASPAHPCWGRTQAWVELGAI